MRKVPKWSEYFMNIAKVVASRSKDPNTQVGCVIVDSNRHIIGTGYNGFSSNDLESDNKWKKDNKSNHVVHSELNALLHAVKSVKGATLYCTHKPCQNCCLAISASGIKEVIFLNDREQDTYSVPYLKSVGILIRHLKED